MSLNGTKSRKPRGMGVLTTRRRRVLLIVLAVFVVACVAIGIVVISGFVKTERLADPDPETKPLFQTTGPAHL